MNRRRFILQSATAAATLMAGDRLLRAAEGPTVAIIRDKSRKVIEGQRIDAAIVQQLVDKAVMTLSGKDDIAKAWGAYVGPGDKVAVKFNGLFTNATTHPEVVFAVTNGLIKAGVDPANIVVYDRDDKAAETARLKVNREGAAPRLYGTSGDYGASVKAGPIETKITNILARADVLINLPMMKTHVLTGVSGALKNHLGTVPNANAFHAEGGRFIADLNALEPIKAKTRICICDALFALFDRGPQFSAQGRWDYCGIIASADPVALDATLADLIKAKRLEKGLTPYHKAILHVERAAELGLGLADLKKIQRVEAEV